MTIKLYTRDGEFVTSATIPFTEDGADDVPDIIRFGSRLFVVPDMDRDVWADRLAEDEWGYVEAVTVTIPVEAL